MGYILGRAWDAGPAGLWSELARPYTMGLLVNTVTLAVSVTAGAAVLGTAAAWCTERCDLPGRQIWRIVTSLPLAMPAFVASYAWASLGPWFQGMLGAVVILTLSSMPLIYLPVAAALRGMDPSLEDVARSLGHGPWRCFFRIVLPQALPALGGGALLVASHMLAEFGALSLLRVQTFTTAIFDQYQMQFNPSAAALLAAGLMALSLPIAFAEMRLRHGRRFARVGRGNSRRLPLSPLGRLKPVVLAGFAGTAALSLGVPLMTLGFWLWHGSSAGRGVGTIVPALLGSLSLALPGAVLTTLFAVPLVMLSIRYQGRLTALADRLPYVVHGLPGIGVALALVFLSVHYAPAIYQTRLLVLLAYTVLFLPLAQSSLRASAELVPPGLEDVARSLGRGPFLAFLTVTLPNLAPGVGAALALVTLQLMRELTATLLLASSDVTTLATELWSYTGEVAYAAAAPFAAALVLISGVPVYVFTLRTLNVDEPR
ncbi:ABC transporter permease [Limobrevibacterium gyesilva]|uniref:Iron ABC transporter permease n=1 Tax=Limobrevibacterium gyesilva TaxID=2991712 RepID=A0AA41YMV5_9PROT|nr:iron ABC transporter permease [Limobrevibacterium gyesilva]MCW3473200.1 iron ABC transporter permease [Limobrevibacterium gyesilva]